MSPAGIVLAGVGAAVGIITGLGAIGAVAIGAGAWATRVGVAIPRGPVQQKIDRRSLTGVWQRFVDEALDAQKRFDESIGRTSDGPLKDRLVGLRERIDEFVRHSYEVAQSGQALSDARRAIDIDRIVSDLHRVTGGSTPSPGSATDQAAQSLQAQLETAKRLDDTIQSTHDRLLLLDARLDELVTRSIELSVTKADVSSLGSVERDLIDVVDEMEAVRQAVAETG